MATLASKPTVVITNDMNGKSTLICRFIRPQNAPVNLKNAHQLCRYVSAIPFLPNRTVFAVTCNLWSTSDQVFNVGAGDSIEHAILLCNLLLSMEYEARVIIGSTLIDGKSAFVIFKNKDASDPSSSRRNSSSNAPFGTLSRFMGSIANIASLGRGGAADTNFLLNVQYRICDPVSGIVYDALDKKCPLQDVTSVFDDKNVGSFS
jgi:coiled-coil and C2 domain-containing protein 2A